MRWGIVGVQATQGLVQPQMALLSFCRGWLGASTLLRRQGQYFLGYFAHLRWAPVARKTISDLPVGRPQRLPIPDICVAVSLGHV
jgi:hypothetical protein